jgi:hypothetical protein
MSDRSRERYIEAGVILHGVSENETRRTRLWICPDCGSIVADRAAHDRTHTL